MAMKRRIVHLIAGLSLLLFVAAGVMWVRSLWRGDFLVVRAGVPAVLVVHSQVGVLRIEVWPGDAAKPWSWQRESWRHPEERAALRFRHRVGRDERGRRIDRFVVPYYLIVAITAVAPAVMLVRLVRARRRFG